MKDFTRREFLSDSLFAAAAAAASRTVPDVGAAPLRRLGPNERLRVAVAGVRGRGNTHVSMWAGMPDVEVAVLCDVDPKDSKIVPEAMAIVDEKTGKKPRFEIDFRKVLEDKSIDFVSIATPNHTHTLLSLWALQAGKDVYVEKPCSHNVWEGRKLVEAARKYGKLVQHGTQSRSQMADRAAMEFLFAGKLGKIKHAQGLCYKERPGIGKKGDGSVPDGVNYDLWLGPAPVRPFNPNRFHYEWHWNWDYGNGDIGNQGVHQMDLCRWGLQKNEIAKSVISLGGRFGYEDDGLTPNTQITLLDYGDTFILFEVRGLKTERYKEASIGAIFHGTDGYLVIGNKGTAAFTPKGELIANFAENEKEADRRAHFRNYVDALKSRKREDLHAEIAEGHLSSALCHLANISYRLGTLQPMAVKDPFGKFEAANDAHVRFMDHLTKNGVDLAKAQTQVGRSLAFDPKKETFVGDAEADKMLTREYRKPFVVPENV